MDLLETVLLPLVAAEKPIGPHLSLLYVAVLANTALAFAIVQSLTGFSMHSRGSRDGWSGVEQADPRYRRIANRRNGFDPRRGD